MLRILVASLAMFLSLSGVTGGELISCPNVRLIDQEPLVGDDGYSVLSACSSDVEGERKYIFAEYYDDEDDGEYDASGDAATAEELASLGIEAGAGILIGELESDAGLAVAAENMGKAYSGDCTELAPNGVAGTFIDDGDTVCIVYWHTNGYRLIFQATGDGVSESGRQTVKDFSVSTDSPAAATSSAIPSLPNALILALCFLMVGIVFSSIHSPRL